MSLASILALSLIMPADIPMDQRIQCEGDDIGFRYPEIASVTHGEKYQSWNNKTVPMTYVNLSWGGVIEQFDAAPNQFGLSPNQPDIARATIVGYDTNYVNNALIRRLRIDTVYRGSKYKIGDSLREEMGVNIIRSSSGLRMVKDYPEGYFEHMIGQKILVGGAVGYISHCRSLDEQWYFSAGDTLWNDAVEYGQPFLLNEWLAAYDSARLANTPILTKPLSNHEPVELWSLSGENLWSGRDWHKSGLPTGVYLLKNRGAQRVVWVE